MGRYVLFLHEIDRTQVALAGGKGAHLGELTRIDGIRVPPGFCVTTAAYERIVALAPAFDDRLAELSRLEPGDRDGIRALSAEVRAIIEGTDLPGDLSAAIVDAINRLGPRRACAVRSSATAEDLPTASFAGQQDTYLNVIGPAAIVAHVRRCWASLFTERAVSYRLHNGFDHRKLTMAVVVQEMVFADVAGIMFTADSVTGNRRVASVEAAFGLGDALVSGRVNADVYKVRDGVVVERTIGTKQLAVHALSSGGGTRDEVVAPERQHKPALTDAQVIRLSQVGRYIETHFGRPQDIEWCLADGEFWIVQSRAITTLFPIPRAADEKNRVYLSVGYQQMMTDAMRPLGISFWQLTAARPMLEAGGRLFVDVSQELASAAGRAMLFGMAGKSDPLVGDALQTVVDRDFIPLIPGDSPSRPPLGSTSAPIDNDPDIVTGLIQQSQGSLATLNREIQSKSGLELLDFILGDVQEMKKILFDPRSLRALMAGIEATWWLNEKLHEWLGEKNPADTLTLSVRNNVTSEMGLDLLDVADVIRPHARVVEFLENVESDGFMHDLPKIVGGHEARLAITGWLEKYGMRGVAEIDITRPRWSERPAMLLPVLLSHIRNQEPGEGKRRFERGLASAATKEQEIVQRLRSLPDGAGRVEEVKNMIDRLRTFIGYREYPKYFMVSRYFVYKEALMNEAARLVHAGILREREDTFYLTFAELQNVVRTQNLDYGLIQQRKDEFRVNETFVPPRVMTSEGEAITGIYRRENMPLGALIGLPVSTGTIEGRARVVLDIADAHFEPGDILVTRFTDPSWTPLFLSVSGLVTEVGGLMTHGAVIAREYGLPAVVGVSDATRLISEGQTIRVNGTDGYVQILA